MASRVVPGDVGDDRPLLAEERVEQARLADVRPADERDRRRAASSASAAIVASQRAASASTDRPSRRRSSVAVASSVVVVADDERLEAAGGHVLGPRLGLGLARLAGDLRLGLGRQRPDDGVEQVADPAPVVAEIANVSSQPSA